ncbi:hypothetical protein Dxin01_00798 [Deinococcus xinjiangensis]|uniref:Uncharacterized protein n=1 Tax=Deinococcus xinjiangensis TaxID=457454 RepID=A0ABP9VBI2_9DEIO
MFGLAHGGKRLCGNGRTLGGWYLECAVQRSGTHPLDSFLVDFPTLVPPQIRLNALGVTLWTDKEGVTHVVDLVGKEHYPYVPDFWEEARHMGFSRKVSPSLNLSQLSAKSRFYFVHERGLIGNASELLPFLEGGHICPTHKGHPQDSRCAGLHWQVTPSAVANEDKRFLAQGEYALRGHLRSGAPDVKYVRAIFASVPITAISHVVGAGGLQAAQQARFQAAQKGGLPVHAVQL